MTATGPAPENPPTAADPAPENPPTAAERGAREPSASMMAKAFSSNER